MKIYQNIFCPLMDEEYAWILRQENNCRQFNLQYPLAFIGLAVYPVGEEGMGVVEIVILAS